jgi:two-component system response regulator AtoC
MITSIENALVVDDDVLMREFIIETLRRQGIAITQAGNGSEAKRLLEENDYDIVFMDLKMPGMDGMQVLRFMRASGISSLVVMVTAFGTVEQAVDAMKLGAADFLMKPFSPEQVELIVKRAREWVELQAQNAYLQEELGWRLPGGRQMVGRTPAMKQLMDTIHQVANSTATVLITGESGTGKELVAHAIHSLSSRQNQPFIRMNCAAVPDTLMDSELFGHEKGSFTGAVVRRLGRFELATRGTLLLDEITEMKLDVQAKLLRVLQEQEFERVGGSRTIRTDCRVIATSNRRIQEYLKEGKFRQDLFYRLNVVPIHVASLRERVEDIPVLVDVFLSKFKAGAAGVPGGSDGPMHFTAEAMDLLQRYSWPGNVRELENLMERLTVMQKGPELTADMLPAEIREPGHVSASTPCEAPVRAALTFRLADIEQDTILRALNASQGNRQKTADILGISIRTLRNKLNEYRQNGLIAASA